MTTRVLIIGGYGNFGGYIARSLAKETGITLIIGGRSVEKGRKFAAGLSAGNVPEAVALDISADITPVLQSCAPDVVIHTTGPFQSQPYSVAEACIKRGCHYIDLADGRSFVTGITKYNAAAKQKNLLVVSGASSVPCLTAAIIDHYRPLFGRLRSIHYGISASQQANRGLATASAILSYVGKPFTTRSGNVPVTIYGWQDMYARRYPELGWRLFGNCDIPDLELFPKRYPEIETIRFSAGHEVKPLHLGIWGLSWIVRMDLARNLQKNTSFLLRCSHIFDTLSTGRSGFHMILEGESGDGQPLKKFFGAGLDNRFA